MNTIKFSPSSGFWKKKVEDIILKAIPYQWKALNNEIIDAPKSYAVQNFKIAAGEVKGEHKGTIFQDSDVAKWIEAAAYSLTIKPNIELEKVIDELVRLIEKSQLPDGYLNTYFIASSKTNERWSDLIQGHELYCAGHMIEAAVAYFYATGKKTFLNVICKYADYIEAVFGQEEHQNHGFDGHPEIELALHRLAKATNNKKYAELAHYFVNIRGSVSDFHVGKAAIDGMIPKTKWFKSDYYLADKPVREMTKAQGHSVRAMYLYSAMADQYMNTKDEALRSALAKIWENVTKKHLYIIGGLGSHSYGERFSIDYDLPNDTCYTETCASIGLAMWAWKMFHIEQKSEYIDIIERTIYNGIMSGISLDCTKYFYVNPLQLIPSVADFRQDHAHVAQKRVSWFDCACCPTNLARFILSFMDYICSFSNKELWIHHFAEGTVVANTETNKICLDIKTNYPWDGKINISLNLEKSEEFAIYIRKPLWCSFFSLEINGLTMQKQSIVQEKGYIKLNRLWNSNDSIILNLDMPVQFISTNSNVSENIGKIALQRGPLIYCAEEADNGKNLHVYSIDLTKKVSLVFASDLPSGTVVMEVHGSYDKDFLDSEELYSNIVQKEEKEKILRFIPYFQWGNRMPGNEMFVWFRHQ